MSGLKHVLIAGLCWFVVPAAVAGGSTGSCSAGVLYYGAVGQGETTAVEVFSVFPPAGEQLGVFDAVLVRADCPACRGHGGRRHFKEALRWHGVVRGRQDQDGMHHALANTKGDGYVHTEDSVDLNSIQPCVVKGERGVLLRETLVVTEGNWDGREITSGQFVADVCIPEDLQTGSKIRFELTGDTFVCLTRASDEE